MSSFYEDLLDFESAGIAPNKKWPSLKIVFDNFRCYPVLGFFWFGVGLMLQSRQILYVVPGLFLAVLLLVLSVACIIQTSTLLTVLTLGILSEYVSSSGRLITAIADPKTKTHKALFGFFVILLGFSAVAIYLLLSSLAGLRK